MANLSEDLVWKDGIYQLETTDPVQGGPDGIDNRQAKELASRTQYLKTQVELRATIVAVNALIAAAVDSILNSSPATLDTLNELAAALGDDPNFAATMTALIGTKLDAATYTPADILAKLINVDGAGSGLDADLLQGKTPSDFSKKVMTTGASGGSSPDQWCKLATLTTGPQFTDINVMLALVGTLHGSPTTVNFSASVRVNNVAEYIGKLTINAANGGSVDDQSFKLVATDTSNTFDLWFRKTSSYGTFYLYEIARSFAPGSSIAYHENSPWLVDEPSGSQLDVTSEGLLYLNNKVWHGGNHGPASGLNADMVDGKHASDFVESASPVFTGSPLAPTQAPGDNSQKIATTEYIASAIAALVASSPGTLDTLNELATALGDDPNFAATMTTLIGTKLNASAFTGAAILALLLAVDGAGSELDADRLDGVQGSSYARKASPAFSGNPTAPTQSASNNSTRLATTAFVKTAIAAVPTTTITHTATSFVIQRSDGLVEMGGTVSPVGGGSGVDLTLPITLTTVLRGTAVFVNYSNDSKPDGAAQIRALTGSSLRVSNTDNVNAADINWSVLGII